MQKWHSLPSFYGACLIFSARRIQPFHSLVDSSTHVRNSRIYNVVQCCVQQCTDEKLSRACAYHQVVWAVVRKIQFVLLHRDSNPRPTVRRLREYPLHRCCVIELCSKCVAHMRNMQ